MIASTVRNPITGIDYLWPTAQQKVATTDQRRVSTQIIPGADGVQSQYGLNPFPRGATQVTISFRVTPRQHGTTFDRLRRTLNLAIDHGLPQRLQFTDDDGNFWFATGWLTGKNLEANQDQQWFADWSVSYLLEDPLAYGQLAGVNAWGQVGLKWGATGLKWGVTPHSYALTSSSISFTIPNPLATADTSDPIFTFTGQWGPTSAAVANGTGYFLVENTSIIDLNTGSPVYFYVTDTVPTGYSYQIDCGSGGVYKTNSLSSPPVATPMIGTLQKLASQFGYMRIRPGDNNFVVGIGGAPLATLNGNVVVSWKPKYSLS
jgi:hypothetical protein